MRSANLTASHGFVACGYAATVEDCKRNIGSEFRRMLSRADLRERADALPRPPRNEPEPSIIEPFKPSRPYNRDDDRRVVSMQRRFRGVPGGTMRLVVAKTVALVLAALSVAPSFAHALEAYPRLMIWSPELWREATVFNAQFMLFAVVGAPIDVLAILVPAGLTFALRGRQPQFALALAATLAFTLGLAIWFAIVSTANSVLATWTPGPVSADFEAVRRQWEFGHLTIAGVKLAGFVLLAVACSWPERREAMSDRSR